MNNKVYVFGSSGHAKVIIDLLQNLNIEIVGLLDSFASINTIAYNYKILGDETYLQSIPDQEINVVIAIGNSNGRQLVYNKICSLQKKINFPNIISPNSIISKSVTIKEGSIIMDGVIVHPDSNIGAFNLLNTKSLIEHDCNLGDFCTVSPNATICGNVEIGNDVFIGASAVIIQKIKIESNSIIGAGAVIIKDCANNTLNVGNPSKVIRENYTKKNYI